jgi:hypothetical protein
MLKLMTRLTGSLTALLLVAVSSCTSAQSANDSERDELRSAIEKNWLIPIGVDNLEDCTVSLRLHLAPDGVVSQIEKLNDNRDPNCSAMDESARRAVLITQAELGHLPVPTDKYNSTIVVTWPMKLICEQRGGC